MADWSALRALLADVDTSVTLAWDELDEMVDGLPRSAYDHAAFWKGERTRWPGFTTTRVRVGEPVTFVRRDTGGASRRPPMHHETGVEHDSEVDHEASPTADVVLVGCVKTKLEVPAAAKDLYISPLFRKARAHAEKSGAPWFILSAKHGLVDPDEVLEPYDLWLPRASAEYRRGWGAQVVDQLVRAVGAVHGRTIEIHAGSAYAAALRELLVAKGARLVEPLAGLRMGDRLAWYGSHDGGTTGPSPTPGPGVDELVGALTRVSDALTPAEFLAQSRDKLRSPGLYSWWVDTDGAAELSRGLGHPVAPGLIYAGLAGATRTLSRRQSTNTLWGRIRSMHLGGNHRFSTFRLSLGSILVEARDEVGIDEEALTSWMHQHLAVLAVPVANSDTLAEVETAVLAALDPPLNLSQVERTPLRTRLSLLRSAHS